LRTEFRDPVHKPGYEFFLGPISDVRCPEAKPTGSKLVKRPAESGEIW
jgi:hypothetical protein